MALVGRRPAGCLHVVFVIPYPSSIAEGGRRFNRTLGRNIVLGRCLSAREMSFSVRPRVSPQSHRRKVEVQIQPVKKIVNTVPDSIRRGMNPISNLQAPHKPYLYLNQYLYLRLQMPTPRKCRDNDPDSKSSYTAGINISNLPRRTSLSCPLTRKGSPSLPFRQAPIHRILPICPEIPPPAPSLTVTRCSRSKPTRKVNKLQICNIIPSPLIDLQQVNMAIIFPNSQLWLLISQERPLQPWPEITFRYVK